MGTFVALLGCAFCGWVWQRCDSAETDLLNAGIAVRSQHLAVEALPASYRQGLARLTAVKRWALTGLFIFGLAAGAGSACYLLGV